MARPIPGSDRKSEKISHGKGAAKTGRTGTRTRSSTKGAGTKAGKSDPNG